MKGGSPPTEPKARTGEFTPPGMTCSARFCNLREASTLRVMDGFVRSLNLTVAAQPSAASREAEATYIRDQVENLQHIHLFATQLQCEFAIFMTLTCSSNRESLRTVSGGSGLSFFFRS